MLDIKFIRENPEKVKKSLKDRGMDFDLEKLLEADEKRRAAIKTVDDLRSIHNKLSEEIAKISGKERDEKIAESKKAKINLEELEEERKNLEENFENLLRQVPNIPLEGVPVGKNESENKVLRTWGEVPKFKFEPKDHVALGTSLDILDFDRASKVSGTGFYYLKNQGVMLELALVHYALDFLVKKGFTPWFTPDLAKEKFYLGTGYSPRGPEAQIYEIKDSDLGLIATAEVTLAGIHAEEVMSEDVLPLRYAGYSHCFRQEAGAYGKYSKGLYRVHQFTKVEMFAYTRPEESNAMHEELLKIEEELWQGLGILYRVLEMCTGDLGAQAARKFDLEAWMPCRQSGSGEPRPEGAGRGDFGEVTSTSNTTDYQARNLGIRCKRKDGKTEFLHTLNGTAIATSRAIVAILENYQQEDGSVVVPEVLRPYMGGIERIIRNTNI